MVEVPEITVITPSVRHDGLDLVQKALNRQTFKKFEWIIVSPSKPPHVCKFVQDPGKSVGDYWSVYKAYNRAVEASSSDLIVSWQDFTFADPDALGKFWVHYKNEPKTLVTAVGNKYKDETFMAQTWKDPRERDDLGSFYQCYPNDIEWNLCSVPKEAIYSVGGFDEYMDKYSSLCGLDVLQRLDKLGGYDFKIDQSIKSYSTEHGRLPGWEENSPFKGAYDKRVSDLIDSKIYPVLNYLKRNQSGKDDA